MKELLVAIDNTEEAQSLIPKVQQLMSNARPPPNVTAMRIIYDGLADMDAKHVGDVDALRRYLIEAESPTLRNIVDRNSEMDAHCLTLWHKNSWQGILHAAETVNADLIAKQVAQPDGSIYLKTPDDWNLLRHSPVPVLLSHASWPSERSVYVALDVHDNKHVNLNKRVVRAALQLSEDMHAKLHIVCVYLLIDAWLGALNTTQTHKNLKKNIENDISCAVASLCSACHVSHYELHIRQGLESELAKTAASATVLVIGTKARTGLRAMILGNTAEKILHAVRTDVLTVP